MKFIFIKTSDIQKDLELITNTVGENTEILELIFNKENLEKRLNKQTKTSLCNKLLHKLFIIKFDSDSKRTFKKILEDEKDMYFIFHKSINNQKDIINYLRSLKIANSLQIYNYLGEMKENIYKYIEEYSKEDDKELHMLKCLIVCKDAKKLDLDILNKIIKECKTVNIYSSEDVNSNFTNKISKINEREGTTIDIVKKEKKSFLEYDICIFYDENKNKFPRLRFSNKALIINFTDIDNDKYDSNILMLQEKLNKGEINQEKLEKLYSDFGRVVVASIILNTSTQLDKT